MSGSRKGGQFVVDLEARERLAAQLQELTFGRITTDAFERLEFDEHPDYAVREIWRWAHCLFPAHHALLPARVRIEGIRNKDALETLKRCLVFLYSKEEYPWPSLPSSYYMPWERWLVLLRTFGLTMLVVSVIVSLTYSEGIGLMISLIGGSIVAADIVLLCVYHRWWRETHFSGKDLRAWPFCDHAEYIRARRELMASRPDLMVILSRLEMVLARPE